MSATLSIAVAQPVAAADPPADPPADAAAAPALRQVAVPLNTRALEAVASERVRRLRRHLVESLRDERTLKRPERFARPALPDPPDFVGAVVRAACTLCRGWCCKGGGEHGYLDERTMARVRRARPDLDARGILRLYTARVPAQGYAGSCVFHGAQGCTLDRALRSDICNGYFCSGLGHFVKDPAGAEQVVVRAGEGAQQRSTCVSRRGQTG